MTIDAPEDARLRAMRRSLLLARIGLVAWAIVVAASIVLVFRAQPSYLWVVLAVFGASRLVLDARRMILVRRALAEEERD